MIPRKVFFTKGSGHGRTAIQSFEHALRQAKISSYNLVTVSSILPPGCEQVSVEDGIKELAPGQIVYLVLSRFTINTSKLESPQRIYASIGVAQPKDPKLYGYIAESNGFCDTPSQIIFRTKNLANDLLLSSQNVRKDLEVETKVIITDTQTHKEDKFTTCISAAVFIE